MKKLYITLLGASLALAGCAQKTLTTNLGLNANPKKEIGVCTYKDKDLSMDAYCNQLYIFFEYGYLKTPNEFQDKVLNLIKEYNGKVISRSEGSEHLLVEFPNDKQIYEIKDKLKKINHVSLVNFNNVTVPF